MPVRKTLHAPGLLKQMKNGPGRHAEAEDAQGLGRNKEVKAETLRAGQSMGTLTRGP